MKTKKAVVSAVSVLALVLGMVALGTPDAAAIDIDTVVIGDIGNANDPTTGYGGVNYAYAIGKYEVTLTQYTAFLNAVAVTDTYSLYNVDLGTAQNIAGIYRTGSSGSFVYSVIGSGNRPVTNVSWFDAARFCGTGWQTANPWGHRETRRRNTEPTR